MKEKELLIIFVKNPVLGKVKSRLAQSIGAGKALSVYMKLQDKLKEDVKDIKLDKEVCYSNEIEDDDIWENDAYRKSLQKGDDLGQRMHNAIQDAFHESYSKVCLIGSDIYDLSGSIILKAFKLLDKYDVVLGPSHDGGYYLIGMKSPNIRLFQNKKWSTTEVLSDTINDLIKLNFSYALLTELNDIDIIDDIKGESRDYLLP